MVYRMNPGEVKQIARKAKPIIQNKISNLREKKEKNPGEWGIETKINELVMIQTLLKKINKIAPIVDEFVMDPNEAKLIMAARSILKEA